MKRAIILGVICGLLLVVVHFVRDAPDPVASAAAARWTTPVIAVEDHTPASWEVPLALHAWTTATGVQFSYTRESVSGPHILVHLGSTPAGTCGWTKRWFFPMEITSADTTLNPGCTPDVRYSLHELGHAIGIDHMACQCVMNPRPAASYPQPPEIVAVRRLYG